MRTSPLIGDDDTRLAVREQVSSASAHRCDRRGWRVLALPAAAALARSLTVTRTSVASAHSYG